SHLGFRIGSAEQLRAAQDRLAAAGICTQDKDGTVSGYGRQDKFWVTDPDGNFWEVYLVAEDVEPASVRRSLRGPAARQEPAAGPVAWEHYVAAPLAGAIPHPDDSIDEARLTGTFNAALDEGALTRVVREAYRALKPGGKIVTHGLLSDRALPG